MTFLSHRGGYVAAFTVALSTLALISMAPADARASERTTFLLSRAADGGFPNGGSRNPDVSHDQRIARVMAYESDASNLVSGDVNNTTDVFIVRRQGPWGQHGTPWSMGGTELASRGMGGAPANGPSTRPALDGDSHHAPSCVAFVSAASNLVPGDTNGRPDAFVRSLSSGAITRVSVGTRGVQGNGTTYDVSVDGDCEQVAFSSDSTNLGGGSGHKQVYVHFLQAQGYNKKFNGQTLLVSASTKGTAGNGDSWQPQFARAGKAVVFTSLASNLARGDANRVSDVYERTMKRVYKRGHHKGKQVLRFGTALVSATRAKQGGQRRLEHPERLRRRALRRVPDARVEPALGRPQRRLRRRRGGHEGQARQADLGLEVEGHLDRQRGVGRADDLRRGRVRLLPVAGDQPEALGVRARRRERRPGRVPVEPPVRQRLARVARLGQRLPRHAVGQPGDVARAATTSRS